ncbi:hypothetical protein ACSLNJ_18145, partial [Escherichia coli]
MKKHLLPLALLFSGISPAQALDVGDISSFMNSDSSTLSKTIQNSTDSGRLINIRLERLSSPLDDGQVIAMDKPDELLLTPASLLLPAQASEVIRFFYKGPADEKERYYRISCICQGAVGVLKVVVCLAGCDDQDGAEAGGGSGHSAAVGI